MTPATTARRWVIVWGCEALVKRDTPDKLEQRSVKCIFIGYPKETMGYYFYFSPENKIVVARYAEFFEKRLISQEISGRAVDLEEIQEEEDTTPSEITSNIPQEVEGFEPPQPPQEEVIPIRRSERTHRAPNRLCLNVEVEEHSLGDLNEPTSYKAAMLDSESDKWIDAMNAEIQSMMDNMVWVLVDLPPGCKTVGSKWLFKKKTDMDGIVHTYKACLVAKGYTQLYGVDYEETFSPVADIRAIRILISIAAFYDYEICFKDPFMVLSKHQEAGIKDLMRKSKGLDLLKILMSVYQKASGSNVTFLILYVDDIIIMDSPMQERLDLNKSQGAHTPKEVNRMKNVPYALANPGELHWTAVKNILKYLRNTKDMFLVYGENPEAELRVDCYCNAGFEIDINDMKSLTGYMEAVWIRKFISGLGIVPTINEPIRMFCDNSAALHFANEPGVQMGARHYHRSNLLKVHTDNNLADPFTKALSNRKLTQHARSMGLRPASSFIVVVVRPVNTRHRWDETCLLDIIVIKSTDVVGMALPVQNINHSAFRSMFEKEKLSGNNFNEWFARLKLVLRVEKKMHVIEQPLPPAPEPVAEPNVVDQWTALYDAHTEIACLMLGSMTPELHRQFELHYPYDMIQELRSMFEKQAGVEKFDLIQSFHACKQEEGKPVADYVLKMKGYVEKLERLGYVLPQDISVGLILNGLTKDFVGFVRNYNMHNMGKTIGEIHAMLIEYEKGLPKKAETPQVMMIKSGKIQKANKKSLNAKGNNKVKGKGKDKKVYIPQPKNPKPTAMERPAKDDACHHCKEVGHWKRNCPVYLAELLKKKKQVGSASSSDYGISISKNNVLYFNAIARNAIYEIDMHDLVPNNAASVGIDYRDGTIPLSWVTSLIQGAFNIEKVSRLVWQHLYILIGDN
ncbi:retrotransposon protein, putative, ty1-copia subclass [Tanacetum coccineum]|uniref:Retrotransposon protein, putative, ty1-copia subclass n=1 Tax=Tanacetum coccineum TaxID=301880 RepID=A0ABQ5BYK3_9ASTR